MAKQTEKVSIGGLSATAMRGRLDDQGRPYWRVRGPSPQRATLWTGYATRDQVALVVADLIRKGVTCSPSGPAPVVSVRDLLTRWTAAQETRRKGEQIAHRTLINYRQSARYWLDAIGDVSVRALSRVLVEDTVSEWLAADVAPRTCKLAIDVLSAAIRWGAARSHCPEVDLSRLSVLRIRDDEHRANARTPTRAEVLAILDHMAGWHRDLVLLQALTGARVGEIAALRVGDWDRAACELSISGRDDERQRRGKVSRRRWPVLAELGAELERLAGDRGPEERLVQVSAREYTPQLARAVREACAFAGVDPFTTHGIRRQVAVALLDGGTDAKTVAELTGHSVATLLRFYVRPTAVRLRDVVARAQISAKKRTAKVIAIGARKRGTASDDEPGGDVD